MAFAAVVTASVSGCNPSTLQVRTLVDCIAQKPVGGVSIRSGAQSHGQEPSNAVMLFAYVRFVGGKGDERHYPSSNGELTRNTRRPTNLPRNRRSWSNQ
ncbi:hypothetical protein LX32DRAFT_639242 [Colletotrichum zoysiae]|uniref:Uncharacterized protein n=1 Tax=Colletotrichum zoysiae TaxID=1216348 RepID=A0AAD9HJN2_9PEZI|nr:hypothetical protein LX32DRAFT_639242 [Colletotrichum zoysiae]